MKTLGDFIAKYFDDTCVLPHMHGGVGLAEIVHRREEGENYWIEEHFDHDTPIEGKLLYVVNPQDEDPFTEWFIVKIKADLISGTWFALLEKAVNMSVNAVGRISEASGKRSGNLYFENEADAVVFSQWLVTIPGQPGYRR